MISEAITTHKSALVVDDSKLARYVLKEMLIEHGIKVETAESAEEALGILSAKKPDVIFMDHMMPGMDGFQAVQAIKSDPSTAKIPILMYTSKDEGVYVNQARALGAVGVLPKKLKPVQLERVLQKLRLIPQADNITVTSTLVSKESVKDKVDPQQAKAISETSHTLEELSRSASEDLEKDSMRQLFRQLFFEQRDSIKQDQHELLETLVKEVGPSVTKMGTQTVRWQKWGLLTSLATLIFIIGLWSQSSDDSISNTFAKLVDVQQENGNKMDQLVAQLNKEKVAQTEVTTVLSTQALQWALNQNSQLTYDEPLNSLRLQNYMDSLFLQLEDEKFTGTVSVKYHSGTYCEQVSNGVYTLANGDTPLTQCVKRTDSQWADARLLSDWEWLIEQWNKGYSSFNIEFEYMGSTYTKQDYPLGVTAKEWNEVAALNNRLEFALY